MLIPFPEWTPDLSTVVNTGLEVCKNVLPHGKTYASFSAPVVISTNALTAACQGAASFFSAGFSPYNFAGDSSKLYLATSNAYNNVSKGGGYTTPVTERWYFAQFGENVYATNFHDNIQTYLLGTSTLFADLGGAPPVCRYMVGLQDIGFLMLANIATFPYRVQWSGFNAPTSWASSPVTQAGFQDLNSDAGEITQIVGGEYVTIFQERAISRGVYVGSPVIFQFTQVEKNRGTLCPGSVIKFGVGIAYLGLDGFYIFDGNSSFPIGANKIDRFFFNDLDTTNLQNVQAVNIPSNQILIWIYPGMANNKGIPNHYVAYNYSQNSTHRWSYGEVQLEDIFIARTNATTIDGLGAIYSSIATTPSTFDSPLWSGGNLVFSGFDTTHSQVTFTGTALSAQLETGDLQLTSGKRTFIDLIKPVIDSDNGVTIYVGERNTISDSIVYNGPSAQTAEGLCPIRSNSRYQRFQINTVGNFTEIIGLELLRFREGSFR